MKPRTASDYRLLLWMLVLMPLTATVSLLQPRMAPWLMPLALYFAYCSGIASHWHNHRPVFHGRRCNQAYAAWLSACYGFPTFAWIPTHNQNHHKHGNGPGDLTRTDLHATRNTLWSAITYPLSSARRQVPAIAAYARAARGSHPWRFAEICLQYATVAVVHAGYLATAVLLHGFVTGALTYLLALGGPSAFGVWAILFTNYVQHVDCDPGSPHDHSRNFVSPALNWLVFNAGYHTVHHEQPGACWTRYPELHRARQARIDPALNPPSIAAYCWAVYVRPAWGSAATESARWA